MSDRPTIRINEEIFPKLDIPRFRRSGFFGVMIFDHAGNYVLHRDVVNHIEKIKDELIHCGTLAVSDVERMYCDKIARLQYQSRQDAEEIARLRACLALYQPTFTLAHDGKIIPT